jgi:hypothetical protein
MWASGIAYQLPMLAHRTSGIESGSWPTPTAKDGRGTQKRVGTAALPEQVVKRQIKNQEDRVTYCTPLAGDSRGAGPNQNTKSLDRQIKNSEPRGSTTRPTTLNPVWVEWLMGYPAGWTALKR